MGIVRPVMELFPQAWVFFLIFILTSTFTMLNLFIAVIVNAIQQEHQDDGRSTNDSELSLLRDEIARLRQDIAEDRGRRAGPR